MKTIHSAGFVLSAILLAASCGCSAAPTVTRGQNPIGDSAVTLAGHGGAPASYGGHGIQPSPLQVMREHYQYTDISHYEVDENGQILTYDPHARVAAAVPDCPTGAPNAVSRPNPACPHCHGHPPQGRPCPACQNGHGCRPNPACPHCHGHPPHGQPCPACQNGHGLHGLWNHDHLDVLHNDYPKHHFTYGYIRPKNMLYPPPQVPGGAVVYPYYTHKGPSDFFRDDE